MKNNLRLVVNNLDKKKFNENHFFEKNELKIILDLYAKMVSEGSWKDYGLNISSKQVGFSVFKNAAENAIYKICKNFKPKNKNLKLIKNKNKNIKATNAKIVWANHPSRINQNNMCICTLCNSPTPEGEIKRWGKCSFCWRKIKN